MLKTILLLLAIGIVFFLSNRFSLPWIHPRKWELLSFWACLSYLNYQLSNRAFANNRTHFVQFFLASTVLRLIVSVLFIWFFLYNHEPDVLKFISNFFVLYLLFTGFEIYDLYRKLQRFS